MPGPLVYTFVVFWVLSGHHPVPAEVQVMQHPPGVSQCHVEEILHQRIYICRTFASTFPSSSIIPTPNLLADLKSYYNHQLFICTK